ncbi:MAG: DUF2110 family protein [Candidatus Thorarchaeota archaeon]|nr:MAG: DUF2110 family protein [Candidatus Thorarchaeota archaeon]
MKHLVLYPSAYGSYRGQILKHVRTDAAEIVRELSASVVKLGTDKRGHITIDIEGEDEEFVGNVLKQRYGSVSKFGALSTDSIFNGQLVDVGKVGYGLYCDIGILGPPKVDVLVPLHSLRSQLSMHKSSLRTISSSLVLVDHLPVEVHITELDSANRKITGELAESTLERINRWVKDDHQRLLVLGCTKELIENALRKSGHAEDIYRIERLGHFEFSLRCKRSTHASGILAAIGPKLKGVPMHLFIPEEVGERYNVKA